MFELGIGESKGVEGAKTDPVIIIALAMYFIKKFFILFKVYLNLFHAQTLPFCNKYPRPLKYLSYVFAKFFISCGIFDSFGISTSIFKGSSSLSEREIGLCLLKCHTAPIIFCEFLINYLAPQRSCCKKDKGQLLFWQAQDF